jgi:dTDP-4-dehydrorhamnose 3,5-epimerase
MPLSRNSTALPDVLLLQPDVHADSRGFFMETYRQSVYLDAGITATFVQDNYSHSCIATLRGLHYQLRRPQAKLVSVVWGEIYDVALDIRRGSPTWGQWVAQRLSDRNRCQLYIPPGFAHGFCVLSENADVMYKCSDYYDAGDDYGVQALDPLTAIDWPIENPLLSDKDRNLPPLAGIAPELLPTYQPSSTREL